MADIDVKKIKKNNGARDEAEGRAERKGGITTKIKQERAKQIGTPLLVASLDPR